MLRILLCVLLTLTAPAAQARPPEPPPPAFTVRVTLTEWAIIINDRLPAGRVVFDVNNAGTIRHSFVFAGQGIMVGLRVPLAAGQRAEINAELVPGEYTAFCPVSDHDMKGMKTTVWVQ